MSDIAAAAKARCKRQAHAPVQQSALSEIAALAGRYSKGAPWLAGISTREAIAQVCAICRDAALFDCGERPRGLASCELLRLPDD